jgi:2-C-methyl-D-erythritol 2,4-cyclodiphosphate synthase
MRVGWGVDAHRFESEGAVLLAGVLADSTRGIAATSDGDVVAHAVVDAILGAAVMGDIGSRHPSDDPSSVDLDSMTMLGAAVRDVTAAGFSVASVDVTVVAQTVRVDPIRDEMRASLAAVIGIPITAVSVKATTTDGLGFTGRDEGLAAFAVAVLDEH